MREIPAEQLDQVRGGEAGDEGAVEGEEKGFWRAVADFLRPSRPDTVRTTTIGIRG